VELPAHVPVLLREVLEALRPERGGFFVDATLGLGGHAEAILAAGEGVRLVGIDRDPDALAFSRERLRRFGDRFVAVEGRHEELALHLDRLGLHEVDGVLADLGVSSMQLDDPARGFSWKHDGPLDLRMNPERGQPAGTLLARFKKEEIEEILRRFGDEPEAAAIAEALVATIAARHVAAREKNEAGPANRPIPLLSTSDVTRAVESAYQRRTSREASEARRSSVPRTFQVPPEPPGRPRPRRPRRDPHVPFRRGPPGEEGLRSGGEGRRLLGRVARGDPRLARGTPGEPPFLGRQAALGGPLHGKARPGVR
jgi:16S rRNA (cytosine(1402)-N(4))-methyltransferase